MSPEEQPQEEQRSLYRRHRPRTFAEVVGQEPVVRTLRNAVERGKVHHAYLFVGSRGTGKTSMAKILAACLNCENGPTIEPCGVCDSCVSIAPRDVAGRDRDGRGVEQLGRRHPRAARERGVRAGERAAQGVHPRRGAHALDGGVERVPEDARGAAAEHGVRAGDDGGEQGAGDGGGSLPPLRLPPPDGGADRERGARARRQAESIEIPPAAVAALARSATGSFRDALGTLEQIVTYSGAQIALEDVLAVLGVADARLLEATVDAVAAGDAAARAAGARGVRGAGPRRGLVRVRPGGARARAAGGAGPRRGADELSLTPEADAALSAQAERVDHATVVRLLELLGEAMEGVRAGADARTRLELALVKAAQPETDGSMRALLARIERLERERGARAPAVAVELAQPVEDRPAEGCRGIPAPALAGADAPPRLAGAPSRPRLSVARDGARLRGRRSRSRSHGARDLESVCATVAGGGGAGARRARAAGGADRGSAPGGGGRRGR